MKILIPNSFCFAAIGIIKTLKRLSKYDIHIIGTGEEPFGLASGSTLVDEYLQSPALNMTDKYCNFLKTVITDYNIELLLCVLDSDLIILDKITKVMQNIVYVNPGVDNLILFGNKLLANIKMQELGFCIPKIITENASKPFICRKNVSVGSSGIKIVKIDEVVGFNTKESFLQEYISGDEYTVDVFCDKKGCPHVIIPRKRIEIRNGMSFKSQLINDTEMINETIKICHIFKIPGLWNVQYIKNDKGIYFIELNPRFAGSAIAGIVASFNYLDLYIDHFVYNKPISNFSELQKSIAWNSIVTRYYEEVVSSINTSKVQ